jgi:hypothetical protein
LRKEKEEGEGQEAQDEEEAKGDAAQEEVGLSRQDKSAITFGTGCYNV